MKGFFQDLFLPHSGNNHRPRLLHNQTLILLVAFLFSASLVLSTLKLTLPEVLGISANISAEELLNLTNQKRTEKGLAPLRLSEELSVAAKLKAQDMFAKNYWAHSSPDGTTPWVFIKKVGYEYRYAGENLARGFTGSLDIVDAWMASKSHRENMLSQNYQDIGFALMEGKLNGQDTILVVEMFGNKEFSSIVLNQPKEQSIISSNSPSVLASIKNTPVISSNLLSRNIGLLILFMFIFVLVLDMIIVERKKIIRLVGHNSDHIFFLAVVLLIAFIIRRGAIL